MPCRCEHTSINAEHEAGQAASTVFQVFGVTRSRFEPSVPALVARAQSNYILREIGNATAANSIWNRYYHDGQRGTLNTEILTLGAERLNRAMELAWKRSSIQSVGVSVYAGNDQDMQLVNFVWSVDFTLLVLFFKNIYWPLAYLFSFDIKIYTGEERTLTWASLKWKGHGSHELPHRFFISVSLTSQAITKRNVVQLV